MTDPATISAELQQRCISTIRFLAADAVQKANSGHPGMPMGAAAMAFALWTRHLKHCPTEPRWPDRDRFVLSAGHGSMLLYSLLYLTGYEVTLDDIEHFRQLDSVTPGHPEYGVTVGVETTTGPLGQGLATAVGMAIAETMLAARYNVDGAKVVDHFTYVIAGDGDLMEGVASEAASLAGHLGLGKLIVLYDDNHISIEGSTSIAFTEDRGARFAAYGWHVQHVDDGNDVEAVDAALTTAKTVTERPSLICVRTHIGFGAPNRQDTAKAHGEPLGVDEVKAAKENLGWPLEPSFYVPEDALAVFRRALLEGAAAHSGWMTRAASWRRDHPELATEWDRAMARGLPDRWDADLPVYEAGSGIATRAAAGETLNVLAGRMHELVGGSADLAPSNNTTIKGGGDYGVDMRGGRVLHFGVREHAMAAATNGIVLHGGLRPFAGTFFVFTDYMRPALRLGALMELPAIYILTHDSIGLGEDGPTHQPVEHLAALRAMPNFTLVRPADGNEAVVAWKLALEHEGGPIGLVLSRQKLPTIDRGRYGPASGIARGGYVLAEAFPNVRPDLVLIASGSEVQLALGAHERLAAEGVRSRVVNLASWEFFSQQPREYRDSVLPPSVRARLGIEAGVGLGWERWLGADGEMIALDRFGASAPAEALFEYFGFTVDDVYRRAREVLARAEG